MAAFPRGSRLAKRQELGLLSGSAEPGANPLTHQSQPVSHPSGPPAMEPEPEPAAAKISLASYARLIRANRNFRRLWMAQIVSEIGDWFYTLSIYTLLLQLTGNAGSVALALVLQVLPQTLVGPTAGVVNDRLKRKHVMIAADLIRCLVVLAMLLVRSRSMVWLVYPLLLAETCMAAFFEPARNAVIPNIADSGEVLVANTLSSATWSVNLMVGRAWEGWWRHTLGGIQPSFSTPCRFWFQQS